MASASTSATGWSIFDDSKLIAHGVIKPKGDDWRDKIQQEWPLLCKIIDKYDPEKNLHRRRSNEGRENNFS